MKKLKKLILRTNNHLPKSKLTMHFALLTAFFVLLSACQNEQIDTDPT